MVYLYKHFYSYASLRLEAGFYGYAGRLLGSFTK